MNKSFGILNRQAPYDNNHIFAMNFLEWEVETEKPLSVFEMLNTFINHTNTSLGKQLCPKYTFNIKSNITKVKDGH
jgi:hypothetical protein